MLPWWLAALCEDVSTSSHFTRRHEIVALTGASLHSCLRHDDACPRDVPAVNAGDAAVSPIVVFSGDNRCRNRPGSARKLAPRLN